MLHGPPAATSAPSNQIPLFNRHGIDLYKLFILVLKAGGFEVVRRSTVCAPGLQPAACTARACPPWHTCASRSHQAPTKLSLSAAHGCRPFTAAAAVRTAPLPLPACCSHSPLELHPLSLMLQATAGKKWASIGRAFNPPSSMTDLSYQIKKIYIARLQRFEEVRTACNARHGAAQHGACLLAWGVLQYGCPSRASSRRHHAGLNVPLEEQ